MKEIFVAKKIYRGIALDIDGTLLNNDHQISDATQLIINKLLSCKVNIVLVSARPIRSVLQIASSLNLRGPMISLNGSLIADEQRFFWKKSFLNRDFQLILDQVDSDISLNIYSGYQWYVNKLNDKAKIESDILGFKPDAVIEGSLPIADVQKVLLIAEPEKLNMIAKTLNNYNKIFTVSFSKKNYLEVTPYGASKILALSVYAQYFKLTLDSFISVGDGLNDSQMIQSCGYGVAMGNAPFRLKNIAKCVIEKNSNDGLSKFLFSCYKNGWFITNVSRFSTKNF